MKAITDRAGEKLKATLNEVNASKNKCFRLLFQKGCGEMKVDTERPSDQVFEYGYRKVLLVDPEVAEACAGATLDYHEGDFRFI
jgi:Fe-S cluster assembly iron-binding protein IscA